MKIGRQFRFEPEVFDIATPDSERTAEETGDETDFESMFSAYSSQPPVVSVDAAWEPCFVFAMSEVLSEPPELEFSFTSAPLLQGVAVLPQPHEALIFTLGEQPHAVIERVHNILTRQEALQNVESCREAMVKELTRWNVHQAWRRGPRSGAHNALASKWVLKWKPIGGVRTVKARLVVQGFRDNQVVKSFASTTTRWGQRLVLVCAVQFSWQLVSADVSEAFLRGLTFKELFDAGADQVLREVQLLLPPGTLPGMEDFDSQKEVLHMLKPGFGLKDAPRLWNLALKRVLHKVGLVSTQVDPQLYVKHEAGKLILLVSVHVDDLKLTGLREQIRGCIKILESEFDALKLEYDNFEHLGLKHSLHDDGSRSVSQQHYVQELRPIPEAELKLRSLSESVSEDMKHLVMSLLGGVAWVVQTRPDVAVFVAALQRRLKEPRIQDLLNLNRVLKYLKTKPLDMVYHKVDSPWRVVAISDSSFKGEDQDSLAVRSGIVALTSRAGVQQGKNRLQVLEFTTKKQSKVCRSTFAAELHSSLDLLGVACVINAAITEVLQARKRPRSLWKCRRAVITVFSWTLSSMPGPYGRVQCLTNLSVVINWWHFICISCVRLYEHLWTDTSGVTRGQCSRMV